MPHRYEKKADTGPAFSDVAYRCGHPKLRSEELPRHPEDIVEPRHRICRPCRAESPSGPRPPLDTDEPMSWPAEVFLLIAPIASVASSGSAFLIRLASMPVSLAAAAATLRLTSLLPKIWPRMLLPSLRVFVGREQFRVVDITIVPTGFQRATQPGQTVVVCRVLLHAAHQCRGECRDQFRCIRRSQPDSFGQLAKTVITASRL